MSLALFGLSPAEAGVPTAALAGATPSASSPPDYEVGKPVDVLFPGDRPLRIIHAQPQNTRAIVYLHGMCGNEKSADGWADVASAHGTVITLRADVPCGDRPGFKWPHEPEAIQARIERALQQIQTTRQGALNVTDVTLVGYSQGAHRAERLVAHYPSLYRRVALGGPPTEAAPYRLRHTTKVAFLGGEYEDVTHIDYGHLALLEAGLSSRFFTLPKAGHGSFGPAGRRVMAEVFDYLDEP